MQTATRLRNETETTAKPATVTGVVQRIRMSADGRIAGLIHPVLEAGAVLAREPSVGTEAGPDSDAIEVVLEYDRTAEMIDLNEAALEFGLIGAREAGPGLVLTDGSVAGLVSDRTGGIEAALAREQIAEKEAGPERGLSDVIVADRLADRLAGLTGMSAADHGLAPQDEIAVGRRAEANVGTGTDGSAVVLHAVNGAGIRAMRKSSGNAIVGACPDLAGDLRLLDRRLHAMPMTRIPGSKTMSGGAKKKLGRTWRRSGRQERRACQFPVLTTGDLPGTGLLNSSAAESRMRLIATYLLAVTGTTHMTRLGIGIATATGMTGRGDDVAGLAPGVEIGTKSASAIGIETETRRDAIETEIVTETGTGTAPEIEIEIERDLETGTGTGTVTEIVIGTVTEIVIGRETEEADGRGAHRLGVSDGIGAGVAAAAEVVARRLRVAAIPWPYSWNSGSSRLLYLPPIYIRRKPAFLTARVNGQAFVQ